MVGVGLVLTDNAVRCLVPGVEIDHRDAGPEGDTVPGLPVRVDDLRFSEDAFELPDAGSTKPWRSLAA